ncbi:MFS general substrate transporter [Gonapodya prolifera JEL478]|uniref:MFS general substrate transporter n=1 Tax=Gonapodya prolifera (strain JEL478) TaxID=1344416 RepID=A0A139AHG2_GONPJ|nr:MFS general substrate transporter [Gonapodya prolifera JEL478]|eukprot:KXS16262.1 MFS general substrate transporter [Gonapodya prolifera JEL478]
MSELHPVDETLIHLPLPLQPDVVRQQENLGVASECSLDDKKISVEEDENREEMENTGTDEKNHVEGGYGWVNVFAMFAAYFWCIGMQNSFGIFIQYFVDNATFTGIANGALSFVATLMTVCSDLFAPLAGAIADRIGFRTVMAAGSVLVIAGQMIASTADGDSSSQLFVGALVAGLGFSFVLAPAIAIPSQWFTKRLGLATALGVSGMGVGGLVLSPITQLLLDKLGWRTAWRVVGLIGGVFSLGNAMIVRTRPRPKGPSGTKPKPRAPMLDLTVFKNPSYWMLSAMAFSSPSIFTTPYLFIPQQVKDAAPNGNPVISGATCLILLNVTVLVGQLSAGFLIRRLPIYQLLILITSLCTLAYVPLYLLAHSPEMIALSAAVLGLVSGPQIVLTQTLMVHVHGTVNTATKMAM